MLIYIKCSLLVFNFLFSLIWTLFYVILHQNMRPVAPLYITTDYNRSKKIFLLNGRMPHFSEDYFSPKNKSFNVNLNTFISLGLKGFYFILNWTRTVLFMGNLVVFSPSALLQHVIFLFSCFKTNRKRFYMCI